MGISLRKKTDVFDPFLGLQLLISMGSSDAVL